MRRGINVSVWINELHYDNAGADVDEMIELAGLASISLAGWTLVLYNGNLPEAAKVYQTIALDEITPTVGGDYAFWHVALPSNGLQNGPNDGIALVNAEGEVLQFLSYEGVMVAADGPAIGLESQDIGVSQSGSEAAGLSLQLTGTGTEYADFTWSPASLAATPGAANAGQVFGEGGEGDDDDEGSGGEGGEGGDGEPVITAIGEIQGTADVSAMVGQTVTVEAIVVGDFQNGDGDARRDLNGFFLQSALGEDDGNALTSEGIFVFQNSLPADVSVGDRVLVTGVVGERFGKTQITAQEIVVKNAGEVADVNTMSVQLDLPAADVVASGSGYQADLEAYESMLVSIPQTLTITEQFDLDRYNEMKLVAGDRPSQFTVHNTPDAAGYQQHLQELAARQITYEDGLGGQNLPIGMLDGLDPYTTATAPRMGDTITGLIGVLDYDFNQWRVRSVEDGSNHFEEGNPRPEVPDDVGGRLKLVSLNMLNYFSTVDEPGVTTAAGHDPRGADTPEEFARQTEKLVNALLAMDGDVLGLVELENDFAAGSPGNALEYLVQQLNARLPEGEHYAWVDPGQQFVGGDAIAAGLLYKPGAVRLADGSVPAILNDAVLASLAGGQALLDQSSIGAIFDGESTSRNPLAVSFEEVATGEVFTVAVNHFKSKGSGPADGPDADLMDGAGAWNQQRELAAKALALWLEGQPTGVTDSDVMILGDLNAYAMESPMQVLAQAGYTNLEEQLANPYSYVFDGQTGSLDYAMANTSMLWQVSGAAHWHINADEADAIDYNLDYNRDPDIFDAMLPVRISDHDPIIVGLNLGETEVPDDFFTLQVLHFSDAEAGLQARDTAPILGAMVDYFDDQVPFTVVLSGGDNFIPGPFMTAGADPAVQELLGYSGLGVPDIHILNALGVDVSAVGNHEWDLGSATLAAAVSQANFPMLSANLDYAGDSAIRGMVVAGGQEAAAIAGKFAPSAVITQGEETIGVVGATTQMLERISSPTGTEVKGFPLAGEPGDGQEFDDMVLLAQQLQAEIDLLLAQGINKIILNSHLQNLDNEKALAELLTGVDIILAAGSHTAMGDANDVARPGESFAEGYPFVTQDAAGETTLIVSTSGEYSYLGRLVVDFDADGRIVLDSLDDTINGAYAATEAVLGAVYGDAIDQAFAEGSIGANVRDITEAVAGVIDAKDGTVHGYSNVYLEGDRTAGRFQETNLGNLTADANAWKAREALDDSDGFVVSLKNGGGIRASIGAVEPATGEKIPPIANPDAGKLAGGISQLDLENALRFDNDLMVFDTTAQGLLNILNYAAGLNPGNGGYAQIGGLAFSYDPALPAGQRVRDVALVDAEGNKLALVDDGEILADVPSVITVVTLGFTANDGDGYPIKANAFNFRYVLSDGSLSDAVDPALDFTDASVVPAEVMGEQQALAEYLAEHHGSPETAYDHADVPASADERIQNLSQRDTDTVLDGTEAEEPEVPGEPEEPEVPGQPEAPELPDTIGEVYAAGAIIGTHGDDELQGGHGNDFMVLGAGDDIIDGGDGTDTVLFDGARSDYVVVTGDDDLPLRVEGPDGVKSLVGVERLAFSDSVLAFDFDGVAGQSYRLYEASFDREPDLGGITYWVRELDAGLGDHNWLAARFLESDEFTQSFGHYASLTDEAFLALLYQNVLDREGEAGGIDYWLKTLESGANRANVLGAFAESAENQANVALDIAGGITLGLELLA